MRKILLSLAAVAALVPSLASAMSAPEHNRQTGIADAYVAGKLDAKIEENYTDHFLKPWTLARQAFLANHRELRHYSVCALQPENCRAFHEDK